MNAELILKTIFAAIFIAGGILHFVIPKFYLKMMPDYIPYHKAAVYVSGVCEIALGVMLMIEATSVIAAWGLIVLLIAVFPANLNMAVNAEKFAPTKPLALWLRLPIQGLLLYWAYQYASPL